jgi:predicted RNA binding protein YcfA (HicA-like mRNA interferase family)
VFAPFHNWEGGCEIPKARRVLAGIRKGGWIEIGCEGSHHILEKGEIRRTFSYHDNVELGTVQLKKLAKQFGFTLDQLKKLI